MSTSSSIFQATVNGENLEKASVYGGGNIFGPKGVDATSVEGHYYGGTATGVNDITNCSISLHNQICVNNEVSDMSN